MEKENPDYFRKTEGDGFKTSNRFNLQQLTQTARSVSKGFMNKRVSFYNQKKMQHGYRFSTSNGPARGKELADGAKNAPLTAQTPGVHKNGKFHTGPQSPVMSKTFENYLKTRENAEKIAKEKVERLNELALKKIKNQKLNDRQVKFREQERKEEMEKHREKMKAAKLRNELNNKEHLQGASEF